MDTNSSVLHLTEAEIAQDLHGVLEKVRRGVEVMIEENARPVVVLKAAARSGRPISECIAIANAQDATATLDDSFARDVEEALQSHRDPWNPPSWE